MDGKNSQEEITIEKKLKLCVRKEGLRRKLWLVRQIFHTLRFQKLRVM